MYINEHECRMFKEVFFKKGHSHNDKQNGRGFILTFEMTL